MSDRIEKQIEIKAPVSRVWRALTDYREFGAWFGVELEGPFVVGSESRGSMTHPQYGHVTWRAMVKEMRAESLFSFTWHPYGIDPAIDYSKEEPTVVAFHLEAVEGGTLLRVTESGFDKVPAYRRDEAFRMDEKGWTVQMGRIEQYVTGGA
jgi:uncharacterized protein YndB with AHSA1/START domain